MTTDDKDKKIETTSDSNHKDTIKQTAIIPNESIMTNPMAQRASKTKAIIDPSELLTLATKKEPSASLDTAQQAPKDNTKNADIQELVNTRLGIADKKPSLQANTFVERMEKTPTLESELETGAPLPQNPYQEPTIETDGIEPHPAQQDVQNFLNERMQKQRHVSLDNEQLAHQRKKLKSLISQTLNGTKNSSSGSVHDNEKQKALKSLLSVPSTNQTGTPNRLIVDPAKRNSLKNFLSQAEQTGKTTRNNPT
ncbi:hypothetical protein FJ364_03570 [Candidatus Dependentiae bacterium]|nr:hypothetical protein [Candidatus Dependentiae bacterium]